MQHIWTQNKRNRTIDNLFKLCQMRPIKTTIAHTVAVTTLVDVDSKCLERSQCLGDMWAWRWVEACSDQLEAIKLLYKQLTMCRN